MVHRGGVKIKDFLENMIPLFNEIVIFKSEKFRFKKKKDLEFCKSCKFFSNGYCYMHEYDKSYKWICRSKKIYGSYV